MTADTGFVAPGTLRNSLFCTAGDREGMHQAKPLATGHNLRTFKNAFIPSPWEHWGAWRVVMVGGTGHHNLLLL